ncbi:hypothetical protein VP01_4g2 [Puccinia sorghi]|uniref:HTH CENPB-type domain-containing protein n=1 Tax=Puccinia sorghi TaxID=27349 RepID=A0A0L6ULP4_9BASI|nr:hypothetical protein VP01_4g2 [Puccinia sorghi]
MENNNNNNNNLFNFFWNQEQQQPTELYVSRFLDHIYITKTTQNNNNQNKLVKKLTLDHLQSNLKHIKTNTAQEEEDLHLINQLLQLNHYDIIPLTNKQLEAIVKTSTTESQDSSTSQATSSPHLPTASSSSGATSSPISSATIFQKNQILDWYHSNGKNQTKTAKHFQTIYPELRIKQPLISAWLKTEESIRAKKHYVNPNVKRMRMIMYPKVDELLGLWAHQTVQQGRHLSDNLLREKWKELARNQKIPPEDWLHLSHGWLSSFKARKGLKQLPHRRPSNSSSSSSSNNHAITTSNNMLAPSDSSSTLCPDLHVTSPQHHPLPIPIPTPNMQPSVSGSEPQPPASNPLAQPALLLPESRSDGPSMSCATNTPLTSDPQLLPLVRHTPLIPAFYLSSSSPYHPSSSSSSSSSPSAGSSVSPTISQALQSIQLLLAYLPSTTTITSDETKLTLLLIDHLNAYHLLILNKIHHSS